MQAMEQEEMSLADREEGEALTGPPGEAGEAPASAATVVSKTEPQPTIKAEPQTMALAPVPAQQVGDHLEEKIHLY
jgi:hypothetical protein